MFIRAHSRGSKFRDDLCLRVQIHNTGDGGDRDRKIRVRVRACVCCGWACVGLLARSSREQAKGVRVQVDRMISAALRCARALAHLLSARLGSAPPVRRQWRNNVAVTRAASGGNKFKLLPSRVSRNETEVRRRVVGSCSCRGRARSGAFCHSISVKRRPSDNVAPRSCTHRRVKDDGLRVG